MRSSRKNLKLRHGSVNAVRPRFEIFPITTELSRLLCCLLYGLQTEEMKKFIQGEVVSLRPAMSVSKFNSNFLAVLEIN